MAKYYIIAQSMDWWQLLRKGRIFVRTGKIPAAVLEKSIISQIKVRGPEVLVAPKIGEDCSVIDFGEYVCVLSTDPITGAAHEIGTLGFHISCNDIASNGVKPLGLMLTILAPEGTEEAAFREIMQQMNKEAEKLQVAILGGHTEITSAVNKIVLSVTALGKAPKGKFVTSSGAMPGNDIVVTKTVGLEGTAIIAADFADRLAGKVGASVIERAKGFIQQISVVAEGLIAVDNGATAMHDITEGGILGAVYEIAHSSGVGVEIWEEKIPVAAETRKICHALGVDPFFLISSGSMLITAVDGKRLVDALKREGIPAAVIGKVTEGNKKIMKSAGGSYEIPEPRRDELYRLLEE